MILFIQSHAIASMASTVARASVLIALVEILILMTVHSKQQHQRMKNRMMHVHTRWLKTKACTFNH